MCPPYTHPLRCDPHHLLQNICLFLWPHQNEFSVVPTSARSTCLHNQAVPMATCHQSWFHLLCKFYLLSVWVFFFASKGLLLCGGCGIILQLFAPCIFLPPTFLSAFTSPPMLLLLFPNIISWIWFCFLKVACLAQIAGHDGRCLGSRGGVMKEDHTENMPCMSLLCLDQMCTMWPNTTVIKHWNWEYENIP